MLSAVNRFNQPPIVPVLNSVAVLRLLQLASPALPVGAYSYSEGLEVLVCRGDVKDAQQLQHWIVQELRLGAVRLEAAVMVRGYRAIAAGQHTDLYAWNHWLSAARETEELRLQSWQMGRSLLRLFQDLQATEAAVEDPAGLELAPLLEQGCNFAIAFAVVAAGWQLDLPVAVLGYLHSWATNLISAGIKLIPLGQTAGQRLLWNLQPVLEQSAHAILSLPDDQLSSCGWGLSLASMAHETQYSRLFRS